MSSAGSSRASHQHARDDSHSSLGVVARGRRGTARRAAVPAGADAGRRPPRCADDAEERLALVEQRDQALAALKELEFDHRTGKITDEDYRRDVGPLRRAAAAALGARPAGVATPGGESDLLCVGERSPSSFCSSLRRRRWATTPRRSIRSKPGSRRCGHARPSIRRRETGAARRGGRLHEPDPRAGGEGRGRLAPPGDARGRPLTASASSRRPQRAVQAAVRQARVPSGPVRGRGAEPRPQARRHVRVRSAVLARRLPWRRERPGGARSGRVPDRHRRAGPPHRAERRTRRSRRRRLARRQSDPARVHGETAVISARASQARDVRDELVGANDLSSTRQQKLTDLSKLSARPARSRGDRLAEGGERRADRTHPSRARKELVAWHSSSAGLIWPASGPVTSPFGWRWGRLHEGIDIGVGYGRSIPRSRSRHPGSPAGHSDGDRALMPVRGGEVAAVVDARSGSRTLPAAVDDRARRGSVDRRAVTDADVDAFVHASPAPAERARHGPETGQIKPAGTTVPRRARPAPLGSAR